VPTRSSSPALVLADVHERASGVPDLLAALGAAVEVAPLRAGDYAIGPAILIERKSMPDLHETILKGRFWRQTDKLRRACRYPFLLIRTEDRPDSAMWLYAMAVREGGPKRRDRPVYSQRPGPTSTKEAAEGVLAAVPGISAVSARALLAHFGTVSAVAAADPQAWMEVRGIGPDRARALAETFSSGPSGARPPTNPSRASRNRVSS
jgi:DNA excision repair protein ERCC-4